MKEKRDGYVGRYEIAVNKYPADIPRIQYCLDMCDYIISVLGATMSELLPVSEYNRYVAIVSNGITHPDLCTEFDIGFLRDFFTKLDKYKRHAYVSDKQAEQFDRIEKYLQEELGPYYEE